MSADRSLYTNLHPPQTYIHTATAHSRLFIYLSIELESAQKRARRLLYIGGKRDIYARPARRCAPRKRERDFSLPSAFYYNKVHAHASSTEKQSAHSHTARMNLRFFLCASLYMCMYVCALRVSQLSSWIFLNLSERRVPA